jgi:hypothetical protein
MPHRLRLAPRGNGAYLLQAMKGNDTIRSDRRLVVARTGRASTQVVEDSKRCRVVHLCVNVFGKRWYVGRWANTRIARHFSRANPGLGGDVECSRVHRPPDVRTVAPRAPAQGPFAAYAGALPPAAVPSQLFHGALAPALVRGAVGVARRPTNAGQQCAHPTPRDQQPIRLPRKTGQALFRSGRQAGSSCETKSKAANGHGAVYETLPCGSEPGPFPGPACRRDALSRDGR